MYTYYMMFFLMINFNFVEYFKEWFEQILNLEIIWILLNSDEVLILALLLLCFNFSSFLNHFYFQKYLWMKSE